jgi:predicted small secreted protein
VLKSRRAVVIASIALCAGVLAGCSTVRTLNTEDVQKAISDGLTAQLKGAYTVTCPDNIEAKTGGTFTCDVKDNATTDTAVVTGTLTDDQGKFTWKVTSANGSSVAPSPAAS